MGEGEGQGFGTFGPGRAGERGRIDTMGGQGTANREPGHTRLGVWRFGFRAGFGLWA